jgi:hypothetical protein
MLSSSLALRILPCLGTVLSSRLLFCDTLALRSSHRCAPSGDHDALCVFRGLLVAEVGVLECEGDKEDEDTDAQTGNAQESLDVGVGVSQG